MRIAYFIGILSFLTIAGLLAYGAEDTPHRWVVYLSAALMALASLVLVFMLKKSERRFHTMIKEIRREIRSKNIRKNNVGE